jgi:hypothetical protein
MIPEENGAVVSETEVTSVVPGRAERILLLGVARSGTRWLSTALGHTDGTRLVKEPDNVSADAFGPYPVIAADAAAPHYRALWDLAFTARVPSGDTPGWKLQAGRAALRLPRGLRDPFLHRAAQVIAAWPGRAPHVVVKSIYAQFAVDWLIRNYQPKVIVIQRHPLNVVSSWLELDLTGFDLLTRPMIREQYLGRLGVDIPSVDGSRLRLVATWVGLLTTVLAEHVDRHPEWLTVTHEDLCMDPEPAIRAVCDRVGLPWSDDVARFLAESNRPGEGFSNVRVTRDQSTSWRRRLTDPQVAEIEAVLAQFPTRGWVRPPAAVAGNGSPR